jgi:hypothetical protein
MASSAVAVTAPGGPVRPCIGHVKGMLNLLIDRASPLATTCSFGRGGWLHLLEQDEKAA